MKKVKLTKPAINEGIMRSRGNVIEVDDNKYVYMIGMGDAIDAAGMALTPAPPPLDRANENFTLEQLKSMFSAISQMNIPDSKKRELEANAENRIAEKTAFETRVEAEVKKRMDASNLEEAKKLAAAGEPLITVPPATPPKPAAAPVAAKAS